MGVPKFYRWISERYPCLSEVIKEFQLPEFDNLYLDMNGIIHICSHPDDNNAHFRISEEKIFSDIFHYIEFLFRMIKPRKVFFMAVDGVAPRAKMNQQRGRRFRSARDMAKLEEQAVARGETLPAEKRFDSNCITPGTQFMVRLDEALQEFAMRKVSSDPLWQGVRVILSGHSTPGEGEHKIMDFIRYERSQPNYNPNTRHCLYGLDADLIMLGLVTHEVHFALLREEVRYKGKKDKGQRPPTPEETSFHLLHLSLLREYLDYEFSSLKDLLSFPYDMENIIDDWVLMAFLVGNDFIPHLPHLHIHSDALPYLWNCYKKTLPMSDGYLNEGGHLNTKRFELLLKEVSEREMEKILEDVEDLKYILQKKQSRNIQNEFAALAVDVPHPSDDSDEDVGVDLDDDDDIDDDDDDDSDLWNSTQIKKYKEKYYVEKLGYQRFNQHVRADQAECYVRAIQWNLFYYYEGVPSWNWFYPHHYAPFVSDIVNIADLNITFEKSAPFLPFEQLMAVLPAASSEVLPQELRQLMDGSNSPIADFYPVDFQTDMNGKLQEWEAVVVIPFIDEGRLLEAMRPLMETLTEEERARNQHGPHYLFTRALSPKGPIDGKVVDNQNFSNGTKCSQIPMDQFCIDPMKIVKGKLPDCRSDVYYLGFHTLRQIPHTFCLENQSVKVFQQFSRGKSMILRLTVQEEMDIGHLTKKYLGNIIYVGWPHLYEAKVVSISDIDSRYTLKTQVAKKEARVINHKILQEKDKSIWTDEVDSLTKRLRECRGIDIGPTTVLLYALPLQGRRYVCGNQGTVSLEKQWCTQALPFALQTTVKNIKVLEPELTAIRDVGDLFPVGCDVFMLGSPYYGCQGQVLEVDRTVGVAKISLSLPLEPNFDDLKHPGYQMSDQYYEAFQVGNFLGTSAHFISRVTGTLYVRPTPSTAKGEFVNIGLNLKFNKSDKEVPGYSKRVDNVWQYSKQTVDIIGDYLSRFSDMWMYVSSNDRLKSDVLDGTEMFSRLGYSLDDVVEFLKQLPISCITPIAIGMERVSETTLLRIAKEVEKCKNGRKEAKSVKMNVKVINLFRPMVSSVCLMADENVDYQLLDRVVSVKVGHTVPFGLRGTVVNIIYGEHEKDTIYEVQFDKTFPGAISIGFGGNCGYRCYAPSLINLTYGDRKYSNRFTENGVRRRTDQNMTISYRDKLVSQESRSSENSWRSSVGQYRRGGYDSDSPTRRQILPPRFQKQNPSNKTEIDMNQSRDTSQPTGVTTPRAFPTSYSRHQPDRPSNVPGNEFADIWRQLKGNEASFGTAPQPPPVGYQPPDQRVADNAATAQFDSRGISSPALRDILSRLNINHQPDNNFNSFQYDDSAEKPDFTIPNFGSSNSDTSLTTTGSCTSHNLLSPTKQPYGQQLSVEQLFKDSRKSQVVSSQQPTAFSQTLTTPLGYFGTPPGVTTPWPAYPVEQLFLQHHHFSNSDTSDSAPFVSRLNRSCRELQINPPRYDYSHISRDQIRCNLSVENQIYQGNICRTREEAANSAASVAYGKLRQNWSYRFNENASSPFQQKITAPLIHGPVEDSVIHSAVQSGMLPLSAPQMFPQSSPPQNLPLSPPQVPPQSLINPPTTVSLRTNYLSKPTNKFIPPQVSRQASYSKSADQNGRGPDERRSTADGNDSTKKQEAAKAPSHKKAILNADTPDFIPSYKRQTKPRLAANFSVSFSSDKTG